ncbi:MAG: hypothetical protein IT460_00305 [Planctomycetes bacterium]|nr:hypothetical protein [Planctomycetota bacterium]
MAIAPLVTGVLAGAAAMVASLVFAIGDDARFDGLLVVLFSLCLVGGLLARLFFPRRQSAWLALGFGVGTLGASVLPLLVRGGPMDGSALWQAPIAALVAAVSALWGATLRARGESTEEPEDRAFAPPGERRRIFRRRRRRDPPPTPPPPPPAAGT